MAWSGGSFTYRGSLACRCSPPTGRTSVTWWTSSSTWGAGRRGSTASSSRVQRRRVFVGTGRVGEIAAEGVRLRRASVNLRQFELRAGERLLEGEVIGQPRARSAGGRHRPHTRARAVRLGGGDRRARRPPRARDPPGAGDRSTGARRGSCSPTSGRSTARRRRWPTCTRRRWPRRCASCRSAAAGCWPRRWRTSGWPTCWRSSPRTSRCGSSRGWTATRVARVLDEMEADDAADLLGELSLSQQAELLGAMDPEEAEPVRRLLTYQPDTAGGLMTPEPVILAPQATVAEALARVRDPDMPVPLAAQVFVSPAAAGDAHRPLPGDGRLPAPAPGGAEQAARRAAWTRTSSRSSAEMQRSGGGGAAGRLRRGGAGGGRRGRSAASER